MIKGGSGGGGVVCGSPAKCFPMNKAWRNPSLKRYRGRRAQVRRKKRGSRGKRETTAVCTENVQNESG